MDLLIILATGIAWVFYTIHITRRNMILGKENKTLREKNNILHELLEEESNPAPKSFVDGL